MNRRATLKAAEEDARNPTLNQESGWLLYRGVKNLLRCDEAEVVSGIARFVISQHDGLRAGTEWLERNQESPVPPAIALAAGLKSFLQIRAGGSVRGAVWIARRGNERQAIEKIVRLVPRLEWTELKFRWRPNLTALVALARSRCKSWRRIFRIARRLHQRYEFFKVLRVAELIGYYMRFVAIFRGSRVVLAVTSNHSNAHGIAFTLAAQRCGVPVALITHGMPVRPVARLSYDVSAVHCEAARQTYREAGCDMGRVFVHGRRQHYAAMPASPLAERLVVGVFLCKDVNEGRLCAVIERLLANGRVSRILVRPHPTNLWAGLDAWIESRGARVHRSSSGLVFSDIAASDIVLAGNSSVLVDAVTAGRPGGYVPGLDCGSEDLHEFVARGLIYPFDDQAGLDPEAMLCFYRRPDWADVLRMFANIDEDEESVGARVGSAMREIAIDRRSADSLKRQSPALRCDPDNQTKTSPETGG
jgi:hypothetical protein